MTAPGWYKAEGDPPGTVRWWDGELWVGEPVASIQDAQAASAGPTTYVPSWGGYGHAAGPTETLSPFGYWKKCWTSSFAKFSGRARRAEIGWFSLINFVIALVLGIPLLAIAIASSNEVTGEIEELPDSAIPFLVALGVFWLASLIPTIAVGVRRWHDMGYSGWMEALFIPANCLPFGTTGLFLWQVFADSKREPNQWGTSPKYG